MDFAVVRLLMQHDDFPELWTNPPSWQARAACKGIGTEQFFVERGGTPRIARTICAGCPVRLDCLDHAMAEPDLEGVWGGTTARERRKLRTKAS